MIHNNHELIVALDANKTYDPDIPGSSHSLPYNQGKPTFDSSHDGKLSTLIATCNLLDPLATQHPERPFPASHTRGSNRVDYIFITPGLRSAVLSSGCLPPYSLFQGDHQPYFLDFSAKYLFRDHTHKIHHPLSRTLTLNNPRKIAKNKETLYNHIEKHNLFSKCKELSKILTTEWTHSHTAQYLTLDSLITEAMLNSEKQIAKKKSNQFEWCPTPKIAIQAYRFWRLKL
jgi:hypothetical protein